MVIGTPVALNLIPGGVNKVVHVNQVNDNIEIQFQIMNGSQPYNVTEGVSCTIRGTKGDSYGYTAEAATTVGSNVVTVTLTEQLTAVAGGCNVFELVFVGAENSMKVSTENFILAVERAALGEDTVISDSDLAYAAQVLDQLQNVAAVNAQVQQNKSNLAAEISRAKAAEAAETAARQAADNTLQSNINAEASTRATTDASLQSQINQLVAPSGSAPSAAEVENARVGADGTVYSTLGDAIRTQVTDVKSAIRAVEDATLVSRNLWEGTTLFGVRTQASGTQLAYSAAQTANYKTAKVKIQPGKTYTIVRSGSSYLGSLTASQDIDAAYIAANTPVTPTNYHVIRTSTTASPSYVNFVADANAEYLYICYTITGEAAQIAVYEGTYTDFQHDPTFYKKSETYSNAEIDSIVRPYNAAVSFLGLDKNLWDGTVFDGVRTQASGTQLAYSSTQTANYKTAKVKIEPNTAYSIIRANSSYLGALTSSQDISLADVIATNPTTPANYKVIRTSGTASPTYVNFTSDANAEYLYICYTLTGEDADLAVYAGTYTDFQGANVYTKSETDALVTGKGSVYGTGDNIYVRCGKMLYNVAHIVNASIHADLWRVYSGAIVTEDTTQYLWNGQDADGVVQIAGEDDFIGGFHGDEILTDFKLFIDGVEQQTYTFDSVNFDEIVIYQESDVYHCNTSDLHDTVAFKRNKVIVFNKDGMTIKNYWKAQESLQLTTAYFGMLSVQKMQTDGVSILNNGYYTNADYAYKGNEIGTPNSPDITEVVFNTALGDVGIKMKDVTAGNYKGNVSYYSTGEVRLKTYMGPIIASNNNPVTVNANGILKGEATIFCN